MRFRAFRGQIELRIIKAKMFLAPILHKQSALRIGRKCIISIKNWDIGPKFRPKMKAFQGNSKVAFGEPIELRIIKAILFLDPM